MPGCASTSTLLTIAPATGTPCAREQRRVQDDLVDRAPDAALADTMIAGAPELRRDDRVRQPDHRPDPGVARALDEQDVVVREAGVRAGRSVAGRSSTTSPAMYAFVKPRGMWTGLITE